MASDLEQKIISQIEYYFGDINLPRDKFLQEKIKEDEGWVTLEVLLSFKRLASLSTDQNVIADALDKSEKKLVVVSEDRKKVRRSPDHPLPELNEERVKELSSRTAYAKGFPLDETLDDIVEFFKSHGPVESCQRRTYLDKATKEHKFKGSCFIIFKDVETCKKFIESESIKYKDVELIRKWKEAYDGEKKKEFEERKHERKNKNKAKVEAEEPEEKVVFGTPGTIIYFNGIKPEESLSWEQIKERVKEITDLELSFIDYQKGLTEGYLRFQKENSASEFYKKLEEGKMKIGEIEISFKLLEQVEEDEYRKKIAANNKEKYKKNKKKGGKFNRKRKGNFSNDGPASKK